jgi:rod shape determining protein RodA
MLKMDRRLLQNVDWPLLGAAFFIIGLSLVCLWSLNPGRGISALMWRQLSWVGVGMIGLLVVVSVDYRNLVRFAPVLVRPAPHRFILGRTVAGARRWIHLGPFTFQPSELFKLIFVLTLAGPTSAPRWAGAPWSAPYSGTLLPGGPQPDGHCAGAGPGAGATLWASACE